MARGTRHVMAFPRLHLRVGPRSVLVASLTLIWLNFATTSRWAHIAGSVHGPKRWLFVAALVAGTVAALRPWRASVSLAPIPGVVAAGGVLVLAGSFFVWFPPSTWSQIPFLDNWPARFQSTMDALALYRQGAATGWEWHFLGGYHTSSDLTVTLGALAGLPVWLLGPTIGFHLLHLLLLLCLPGLVYLDLRLDDDSGDLARLGAGLVGFTATGWFSYYLVRSGDTNSLAGTVCAVAALCGSHAASRGRRWGGPLLVLALALVPYSHAGFFVYTALLLLVESAFYRSGRRLARSAVAVVTGVLVSLPLTWESWRYPAYFTFNNVALVTPPFAWAPFLRKVYYNVEILFLPWRWFNDFTGLTHVMLPVLAWVAWKSRDRASFFAWAGLVAMALLRLNTPEFGYAFLRPVHLLAIFPPVALAGFLVSFVRSRVAVASTVVLSVVYLQYSWMPVPHVTEPRALDPALVDHVRALDGAMVLLENTFHRDMDADPSRDTEPTPFDAHLEGLLVPATGKRFYAGLWDGWQWSPFRVHLMSGGAFMGRQLASVPREAFAAELRNWGVRHLLVWSREADAYLGSTPRFARRWRHGRWTHFEWLDADPREVVTESGRGSLGDVTALGAEVRLEGIRAGDLVVVRTNYYPAWVARSGTTEVLLFDHDGQLAFRAPAGGRYSLRLEYPRRPALLVLAAVSLLAGLVAVTVIFRSDSVSVGAAAG